jgi:hypothetical protein
MAAYLTPEQLEQAIELQRRCMTQGRIAEVLGVHRMTVSRSLGKHNRKAWARLEKRTASEKAKQVEQLRWAAEQAAEAWARQFDPALLGQLRGALTDIRKVAGLDAPEKKAPGDQAPPAHDLGGVASMVVEMVERMSRRTDGGSTGDTGTAGKSAGNANG